MGCRLSGDLSVSSQLRLRRRVRRVYLSTGLVWTHLYSRYTRTRTHTHTCTHRAHPCPAFLVVVTCARLVVVNWTFHMSIWLLTGDGRLPMPVPHLGTLYLTVSRTLILLCRPSNAILRLSFFLHTNLFKINMTKGAQRHLHAT